MTQNTRSDKRAKVVSLLVRYKSTTVEQFIENSSHDVGRDGIFVKSPTPFAVGTLLRFELRLATEAAVLSGVGRVVWKREPTQATPERPPGMGLAFVRLEDASRAVIDRLLEAKPEAGRSYSAEPPSREHLPRGDESLSSLSPAPLVSESPPSTSPRPAVAPAAALAAAFAGAAARSSVPRLKPLSAETPRVQMARPAAGRPPAPIPAAGRPSEPRLPAGTVPDVEELVSSSKQPVLASAVPVMQQDDGDDDDRAEGTVVMASAPLTREPARDGEGDAGVPLGETLDPALLAAAAAHRSSQRDLASGERLALGAPSTPRAMAAAAPSMMGSPSGHMMGPPSGHMMGPPSGHMMGPPSGHMMGPPSGHMMGPPSGHFVATPSAPMVAPNIGWPAHPSQPALDLDLLHPAGRRRGSGLLAALLGMIALLLVVIVLMLVGGGFFLFKSTRAAPVAQQAPTAAPQATASLPSSVTTPSPAPPAPAAVVDAGAPAAIDPSPAAVAPGASASVAAKDAGVPAPPPPPHVAAPYYRRPAAPPAQPQLPAWARDPSPNDPEIVPTKPSGKH